ncbi:MAG: hypothetical protein RSA57_03800 [Cetobacterium sp.]|uniref:hypothetical protein n=1 Tax=Bacteria TaxID=2 RepID=UPI002FCA39B2
MSRIKKDYMVSSKSIEYIDKVKKLYDLKYNSEALELIIREHEKNSAIGTEEIIKIIGERVAENIKSDLLGIKKAANSSDKNSQIMIEMINGMFFKEKYGIIVTTADDKSPALKIATEEVEKKIISKRVSKLDGSY